MTEAELRYLVRAEWVHTADDALWRRSKLGLRLSKVEVAAVAEGLRRILETPEVLA
jgi:glycerol-3-phosphate dehydrogenase